MVNMEVHRAAAAAARCPRELMIVLRNACTGFEDLVLLSAAAAPPRALMLLIVLMLPTTVLPYFAWHNTSVRRRPSMRSFVMEYPIVLDVTV